MLLQISRDARRRDRSRPGLNAGNDDQDDQNAHDIRDDVENIVGILIILIVVAAGGGPRHAAGPSQILQKHPLPAHRLFRRAPTPVAAKQPVGAARRASAVGHSAVPGAGAASRGPEIRIRRWNRIPRPRRRSSTTASEEKDIERRIAKVKRAILEDISDFKHEKELLAAAKSSLDHDKTGLMQLEVDVQKAEAQKKPATKLEHRLTPLSRMIQGKELHYQLL